METHVRPIKCDGERVWRTWPGGRVLDRLHGIEPPRDGAFPEEWMLSLMKANNVGREDIVEGLAHVSGTHGSVSLKELVDADPDAMLGKEHCARFGSNMGVLAKLLDSRERLQLQVHPDRETAKRLFGSEYGKTEAWHILALRKDGPPPCLYIGFNRNADPGLFRSCFERQDSEGMLSMLNRMEPKPGETYLVPGGAPHAIGPGCFLMEIQEPTELTIRLERRMYGTEIPPEACHMGLGFDRMFECLVYDGKSPGEAATAYGISSRPVAEGLGWREESIIGYCDTPYFKLHRLSISGEMTLESEGVFSGLYVQAGSGCILYGGEAIPLAINDQVFLPANCRNITVAADGEDGLHLLRFFGPQPLYTAKNSIK